MCTQPPHEFPFARLATQAQDITIIFDHNWNVRFVNEAITTLLGYTTEEFINNPYIAHDQQSETKFKNILWQAVDTRTANIEDLISRHTHKNQKDTIWLQSNINFMYEDGNFQQALVIARNISRNKLMERKLHLLSEELLEVQDLAKIGGWELDIPTQKQTWSRSQCALFEIEPSNVPKSFADFLLYVHPDDRHLLTTPLAKIQAGQFESLNPNFRIITAKTKTIKYLSSKIKPIYKDNRLVKIKGINQDITERLTREQALHSAYQNLVDSQELADLGSWQYDVDTDVNSWSDGECKIYEIPKEQAPANLEKFLQFVHPEDRNIFSAHLQLLHQSTPSRLSREVRIFTGSGKMKFIRSVIKPVYEDGRLVRIKGITQDITRQKEYENQIRRTHEQFRTLFHAMNQGVVMLNESCIVINANPAMERITGIAVDNLMGSSLRTLVTQWRPVNEEGQALDVDTCKDRMLETRGGQSMGFTVAIFNPVLSEYRWLVINGIQTPEDLMREGSITYITIEDITAHRKSFELLKQSEQKFSDGFKYSAIGMTMSLPDGRLVEVNEAACNILGYTKEELIAMDVAAITHPEDIAPTQKQIKNLLLGRADSFQLEKRYLRKDRTLVWAILTVSVIKTRDGKPHYLIGQIQDITRLRETEKSLRETDRVFKLAQNYAKIGSWHWQIKSGGLSWSDSVFRIFGLNPKADEVSYLNFLQSVHPEDRDKVEQAVENALSKGVKYELEHRIRLKSGKVRWVVEKGNVIRDHQGDPIEMYGIVRDITEAKKISEELNSSRELYQLLAESGQEIIALHSDAGEMLYVSPSVQALLGYKPKELVGKMSPWDLTHPEDLDAVTALFDTARKNRNRAHNLTIRLRHKNGHYTWCANSLMAIESPDKKNLSFRSLTWNVQQQILTDQKLKAANAELTTSIKNYQEVNKKLEVTLRELNKKTAELVKTNRELIKSKGKLALAHEQLELKSGALNQMAIVVMSDRHGRILEVNRQFLKLTGYRKKEVLGKSHCILPISMFNSGMHPPEFFDQIWECLNQGKVWQGEICNRTKSGKLFWLLKTIVPLVDKTGKVQSFFSFSNDITDQKKKENELIQAKQLAEEASAIKEDFLSVMSHEIRTPLNSVIGLSNLLMKKNPREDQLPILETLTTSSDTLLYLVNDILDYNKIKTQKIELEHAAFSVLELVRQLQASYQHIAEEKGLQFKVMTSAELPAFVRGDVNRLNQILNNLINNAIKFTQKGTVTIQVSSEPLDTKSIKLIFEIQDTGIGIQPDQVPLLFTPFHQAERNIARKFGGTGLGLSIVKGLLDLFKGDIHVESTPGIGTTLTFWIPLSLTKSPAQVRSHHDLDSALPKLQVLYVEDVESNQLLVRSILEEYGVTCEVATTGSDALVRTRQKKFHIILMDLQLPGLNGYEVTTRLRRQKGKNMHTPVIAFTAEPYSEELKQKTEQVGFHSIITKPFKFETLIDRIRQAANSERPVCSMQFYEEALNGNAKKIREVKAIIVKDLNRFYRKFSRALQQHNHTEVTAEIHKMLPILKNLHADELLDALQPFRQHNTTSTALKHHRVPVQQALEKLITEVKRYRGPNNNLK